MVGMSSTPADNLPDTTTPEWVRDAVFYQIFPDRFAKSERVRKASNLETWESPPTVYGYKGGDLLGVVEKLDYLQNLGITALYFNPVFQSASNHRYHTHDYYQVDPMLGGNAALRELVDACHERGMKIVLDGVFNHSSRGFFQFNDILENGPHSAYLDWFNIRELPLKAYSGADGGRLGYDAWWGLPALPKFNTDTPAVRDFLWDVGTYWLEFGVDGWRLDVPNEIADDAFWREFRRRCREVNPECYIVGEIWDDASHWLKGDQFDAVMNYPFTRAAFGFTATSLNEKEIARCGYQHIPKLDATSFAAATEILLHAHRPEVTEVQLNLLGSHDTPRALTVVNGDEAAYRMALLFQMTFPGAPCLYYGDELGLTGGHDPECRQGMPWDDKKSWNEELLDYTKHLIKLRLEHPALRRGEFETLHVSEDLYVYTKRLEDATFVGFLNVGNGVKVTQLALPDGTYRDLLDDGTFTVQEETLDVDLLARSGALFQKVG